MDADAVLIDGELLKKISAARLKIREASYQIAVQEQIRHDAALELHSYYEDLCQLEADVTPTP